MKTDPKTTNPIRALSRPEHPETDNNKRHLYEVTVHRTDYRYMLVRVEAKSDSDAEAEAEYLVGIAYECEWDTADKDLYTFSVEQVKEGGSNV
jgi:hypothetical protein